MRTASILRCLLGVTLAAAAAGWQQVPAPPQFQISGTVVDHLTNRPTVRALVRLSPINAPGQLTSLTGEDGRFAFSNIPKGKYRLSAQRRGQLPQALDETDEYSTAIVVGPGLDATNITFPLRAPAAISGVALDEDGEGLRSANVSLFEERVVEGEKLTLQREETSTNSLGQFHLDRLPAGTYFVAVRATPWFTAGVTPVANGKETDVVYPLTYYGGATDAQTASPITLAEGETAQLQVTLRPLPNIHIPLPETVRQGGAIPQAFVRGPGGARIPVGNTYSGGSGFSELTGLPAGRYLVQTHSHPNGFSEKFASHELNLQEVDLADGVPLTTTETTGSISISGQLTIEGSGRPANPLQLLLSDQSSRNTRDAAVSADGSFTFAGRGILPGLYSVRLRSPDYYIKSLTAKGAKLQGDHLELLDGSSAKLSVVVASAGDLAKLNGFVLQGNKPAPGVMVLLVPDDLNRSLLYQRDQSDSDGSFTMAGIPPGRYTLLAIDDDGRDLLYKNPSIIQPYLAAGQIVTFPLPTDHPVKIQVQPRIR